VSVYVDASIYGYGRMIMCHMIADTPEELHAMAHRIGVARKWFQDPAKGKASFWHYDIAKNKRALAVEAGAIERARNEFVVAMRRIRASGTFQSAETGFLV
jgi:hypothetical protein